MFLQINHKVPPALILALLIAISCQTTARAKLGEDFNLYKSRISKAYKPAGQSGSSYLFQLNPEQKNFPPGYAAGLTITVGNGKVSGESIAIRAGGYDSFNTTMTGLQGFTFVYDAIGKPIPTDKKQSQSEFTAFNGAVEQAMRGIPQSLKYPGYSAQITMSKDTAGNLIIAVMPPAPAAALPPPPGAASKHK